MSGSGIIAHSSLEEWHNGKVERKEEKLRRAEHTFSGRHAPRESIDSAYESLRVRLEYSEGFEVEETPSIDGYEQFEVYRKEGRAPAGTVIRRDEKYERLFVAIKENGDFKEHVKNGINRCRKQTGTVMHEIGMEDGEIEIYTNSDFIFEPYQLERDKAILERIKVLQNHSFPELRRAIKKALQGYEFEEDKGRINVKNEGGQDILLAKHYGFGDIVAVRQPAVDTSSIGGEYARETEGRKGLMHMGSVEGVDFYTDSNLVLTTSELEGGILRDFDGLYNS